MPRTPKSPQEKKRLSLKKDRRNTYGESDKGSRKTIPRNKARSHRAVRHAAKAALETSMETSEDRAETVHSTLSKPRLQKGKWRKEPDTALGLVVKGNLARRIATVGARKRRRAVRKAEQRT